jgi:hypothetical protein
MDWTLCGHTVEKAEEQEAVWIFSTYIRKSYCFFIEKKGESI